MHAGPHLQSLAPCLPDGITTGTLPKPLGRMRLAGDSRSISEYQIVGRHRMESGRWGVRAGATGPGFQGGFPLAAGCCSRRLVIQRTLTERPLRARLWRPHGWCEREQAGPSPLGAALLALRVGPGAAVGMRGEEPGRPPRGHKPPGSPPQRTGSESNQRPSPWGLPQRSSKPWGP